MRFNTETQRHEGTQRTMGRTALWNSASLCLCVEKRHKRAKDEKSVHRVEGQADGVRGEGIGT